MTRRFVNQLADGESIDQVFLASEKQLRTNRNGNYYLQLRLSDKTGSVTSMLWNANEGHYESFSNGDYVHVKGTSQVYNGGMQVLAKAVRNHSLESTFRLLETLAEELSEVCFGFACVRETKVRIEKLDRYADIGGIGVEIARRRSAG